MRLPALLVSHLILVGYDIAIQLICGCQGHACVAQAAVSLRLWALGLGLSRDVGRRYTFMQQQQQQQQQHSL
jgi:hypothetical protein